MIQIKNWKKFQHFKNRRPPWIKLHRDVLDDHDINLISDRHFSFLIKLWLLASEDRDLEGKLPEIKAIAWRLRMPEKDVSQLLCELGNWVDISVISDRNQNGPSETETETEKEPPNPQRGKSIHYSEAFEAAWKQFPAPGRIGKQAAWKVWERNRLEAISSEIAAAIESQVSANHFRSSDGKDYVPHFRTWLNQGRWEDEVETESGPESWLERAVEKVVGE